MSQSTAKNHSHEIKSKESIYDTEVISPTHPSSSHSTSFFTEFFAIILPGKKLDKSADENEIQEIESEAEESTSDTEFQETKEFQESKSEEAASDTELQDAVLQFTKFEESIIGPTLPSLSHSTSLFIETLATFVQEINAKESTYDTDLIRPTLPNLSHSTSRSVRNLATALPPYPVPWSIRNLSRLAVRRYSQIFASAAQYDRRGLKVPSYLAASAVRITYNLYDDILASICVLQGSLDRHLSHNTMRRGGDGLSSGPTDINSETYIDAELQTLYQRTEANVETFKKQYMRLIVGIAEQLRSDWNSGRMDGLVTDEFYVDDLGPFTLTSLEELLKVFYHREGEFMGIWERIAKRVADALDEKVWAEGDRILGL